MRITVLGLGYIGLPTAAMLAHNGHDVVGYDIDASIVESVAAGSAHVVEPEVRSLAASAVRSGRLHPSTCLYPSDAYVICVPTPTIDHRPDLSAVERAFTEIAPFVQDGNLVLLESTVPPYTTERIAERVFSALSRDLDSIHLAHCPERVMPGHTVEELRMNDRVVGGRRPADAAVARTLYDGFVIGQIHETDLLTAETVKVVENTYRDVNIAFANELAVLCEDLGVDAYRAIELANCHPRVNILTPGPGVGGHCIPVDPHFLTEANPFGTELIQTARRVNERMPHQVVRRVREFFPGTEIARKVTLLGAAYKAEIDDARETPALAIERLLLDRGFHVNVYDPYVKHYAGNLTNEFDEAVRGADALVLVTDHHQFMSMRPIDVVPLMRSRYVIDARNVLDREQWAAYGFTVHTIGRGRLRADALAALAGR